MSRINSYRALASPSLIALSSTDPILTAFELSDELKSLAYEENEFSCEYMVSPQVLSSAIVPASTWYRLSISQLKMPTNNIA